MMGGFSGCCGYGGFGIVFNAIVLIVFVLGVFSMIIWITRRVRTNQRNKYEPTIPGSAKTSPGEVLAIRYASGEIDRDQFKKMLSDIE